MKVRERSLFNKQRIADAINKYNKSIVENSFRRLEKEGRITRSVKYFFKTVDGNYEEVDEERYEEAYIFKKDLVETFDVKYNQYIQAYFSIHKSEKMKSIIDEVDEQMGKVTNCCVN